MSEAVQKKQSNEMVRLTLTLLIIAAVCALLLGLVNSITAPRIADAQAAKAQAAKAEVLQADSYESVPYTANDPTVAEVFQAGDAGYVVELNVSGFGGNINMMVGVDNSGACTGVSIVSMSETAGLGANAKKEDFRAQFSGQSGTVQVSKDSGAINALTGATITSRAVCAGVTSALEAVASLG